MPPGAAIKAGATSLTAVLELDVAVSSREVSAATVDVNGNGGSVVAVLIVSCVIALLLANVLCMMSLIVVIASEVCRECQWINNVISVQMFEQKNVPNFTGFARNNNAIRPAVSSPATPPPTWRNFSRPSHGIPGPFCAHRM
jgi:hypothetical protein